MNSFPVNQNLASTELCELGLKYKTDKVPAVFHSYTPYYHELLKDRRDKVKRVLEIGIGYPKTMKYGNTEGYVIGASLYMWRDYFPNAEIFAVDNQDFSLINKRRIHSFLVDQSDEKSLMEFCRNMLGNFLGKEKFDLIVDDGSHKPEDQKLTARILAPLLAEDGIYIIEDVMWSDATTSDLPLPYFVKDFNNPNMKDDRVVVMAKSPSWRLADDTEWKLSESTVTAESSKQPVADEFRKLTETIPAPLRQVAIVVLTKYKSVFDGFHSSLEKWVGNVPAVCVHDGSEVYDAGHEFAHPASWTFLAGPEKFSMAGNGNIGLRAVPEDHDVLYCGDDIRFLEPDIIAKLQAVAYAHPEVGILSPRLEGRSSPQLAYPQTECDYVHPLQMWFPCVYIKRELINKIGYLDERFSDFGCDDLDYNIRTELAGYKLAVTNAVAVQHEYDKETGGPTTFVRNLGKDAWENQQQQSLEKLREKYGVSAAVLSHFLATDDIALFKSQTGVKQAAPHVLTGPATTAGSRRGLEGKSLFIMVPIAHPSMNFLISWTHLILALQKFGVPCEYMLLNNESLVPRARNRLADYFRKKTTATHALFIDDDIGFEPTDVIAMLDLDLEISGAACVKKSIRFDRIQEVVKNSKNGHKYSTEDLSKLAGDFILNFDKFEGKKTFSLGEPQPAHSVGTGLMMVRRDVFDRIAEAHPDRWYDSSRFDPSSLPGRTHDFFPVGVNYDTRDYDSEDYRFCIDARKLGMKVWVLPWMKTTHAGMYTFTGDLAKMAEMAPEWVL